MNRIRVAVNGYGVIGLCVADSVPLREDMELVGVADLVSIDSIKIAEVRGKWKPNESLRARNRHLDKLRLRRKARRYTEKKV